MSDQRVALVCGGSRGIGLAAAKALASSSVAVTLLSRDAKHLADAVVDVESSTGHVVNTIAGDVAQPELPDRAVAEVLDRHGRLDILVNNAGGPSAGYFRDLSSSMWEEAFQLSVMSVVRFTRAAVPTMVNRGWGRVINVTTILAKEPDPGMVISATLRAGVAAFTKATARELAADGVTVNNVCPSAVETDRAIKLSRRAARRTGRTVEEVLEAARAGLPSGRLAAPEECAAVIAFLASEQASYVSGVSLEIDAAFSRSVF